MGVCAKGIQGNKCFFFLSGTSLEFGVGNGVIGSNIGGFLENISKSFENERRRRMKGVARPGRVLRQVCNECLKGKTSATIFAMRGSKILGATVGSVKGSVISDSQKIIPEPNGYRRLSPNKIKPGMFFSLLNFSFRFD